MYIAETADHGDLGTSAAPTSLRAQLSVCKGSSPSRILSKSSLVGVLLQPVGDRGLVVLAFGHSKHQLDEVFIGNRHGHAIQLKKDERGHGCNSLVAVRERVVQGDME